MMRPDLTEPLAELLKAQPRSMPEIEDELGLSMRDRDDQRQFSAACKDLGVKWDPYRCVYALPSGRRWSR